MDSLHEIFDAIDNIWRNPLPSSYMEVFSGISSFRTVTDPRSFIIHVGDEEYVTIDETILCMRFRLVESTLLVERGEFDENGAVLRIVYIRPTSTKSGWQYRVGSGSYTIVGAHIEMNVLHASTYTPQTYSSLDRRSRCPMMSPLPTIAKVPEHSVEELSLDDIRKKLDPIRGCFPILK